MSVLGGAVDRRFFGAPMANKRRNTLYALHAALEAARALGTTLDTTSKYPQAWKQQLKAARDHLRLALRHIEQASQACDEESGMK